MVLMRVCPWCRRTEPWRRGCDCLPDPVGPPIRRSVVGVDAVFAVHRYDDVIRRFVLAGKNGGRRDLLARLGGQVADMMVEAAEFSSGGCPTVVWIPASRSRRRVRGYDQGRILARSVGRSLAIPVRPVLGRVGVEAQEGRDRADRLSGPRLRSRVRLAPRSVVLVDDVVTTGASIRVAAAALRRAGTETIVAATVASSGSDKDQTGTSGIAGLVDTGPPMVSR